MNSSHLFGAFFASRDSWDNPTPTHAMTRARKKKEPKAQAAPAAPTSTDDPESTGDPVRTAHTSGDVQPQASGHRTTSTNPGDNPGKEEMDLGPGLEDPTSTPMTEVNRHYY